MAANQTGLRTGLTGFVRVRMRVHVLGGMRVHVWKHTGCQRGYMSSCVFNLI